MSEPPRRQETRRRRPPVPFAWLLAGLVVLAGAGAAWGVGLLGASPARTGGSDDPGPPIEATGSKPTDPTLGVSPSGSPTPCPCPKASPLPSPRSSPPSRPSPKPGVDVPTGRLLVAPGRSRAVGSGAVRRFVVEVEEGLPVSPSSFAAKVESVLFDPRGWIGGGYALQRVSAGPVAFRVTLARPATTDRLCAPLRTNGYFSCYMDGRAVLNHARWTGGAPPYAGDLASYRVYMVNHEVGHALAHRHRACPGTGLPAPVMVQQTKGLFGCARNPWPTPEELG